MTAIRHSKALLVLALTVGAASKAVGQAHSCAYPSLRSGEMEEAAECGDLRSGRIAFPATIRHDLRFEPNGLSAVWQKADWFYVTRQGKAVPVLVFDNGPDYFSEGLAQSNKDGTITFVDRRLIPVLVTPYTWASPFHHGRADVCLGCTETQVHPGSEHTMMTGGAWGVINRTGRVIVPIRPTHDAKR